MSGKSSLKPGILIYSDCFTFSGSENVIENLLRSQALGNDFRLLFYYAGSPDYNSTIPSEISQDRRSKELPVLSAFNLAGYAFYKSKNLGQKSYLLFIKYFFLILLDRLGILFCWNLILFLFLFSRHSTSIIYLNNGGYPGAKSISTAILACRLLRIQNVILNVNNLAKPRKTWFQHKTDHFIARVLSRWITASRYAGNLLNYEAGFCLQKYVNIPNTLSVNKESRVSPSLNASCSTYELVIGNVGLLTARKGQDTLITAFSRLLLDPDLDKYSLRLEIYGEGEERKKLEHLIHSLKIDSSVKLNGFHPDVFSKMQTFDLLVIPSLRDEDFPYVVLEAMVSGLPVIGTRVAGIPEQILDGETGYIVSPGDDSELYVAMKKLIVDKSLRDKFGYQAAIRYHENFSNEIIMGQYIALFTKFK